MSDERTDENTLAMARLLLQRDRPVPPALPAGAPVTDGQAAVTTVEAAAPTGRAPRGNRPLIVAVILLAIVSVAGLLVARSTLGASDTTTTVVPTTTIPAVETATVDADQLGEVIGPSLVDGQPVAYPGQPVGAPAPASGRAVGWQWQLCPTRTAIPARCSSIGGAITQTWQSPPTPEPVWIRAVVLVERDGTLVQVATPTFQALGWPDGIAPGQAPTTTEAAATTQPPTTTAAPNPYGDPIGSTITAAANPAATLMLDLANHTGASPTAGSNHVAAFLRWVQLRTFGAVPGTVTATEVGYQVDITGLVLRLDSFNLTDTGTITDFNVCLDTTCGPVTTLIVVLEPCEQGAPYCLTVTGDSAVTAYARAVVSIGPAGPAYLYETISPDHPVTGVTDTGNPVPWAAGWFLVQLPGPPPSGATQDLHVIFGDDTPPGQLILRY